MAQGSEQRQLEKTIRQEVPGLLNNLPGEKKQQLLDFLRSRMTPSEIAAEVVHQSITHTSSPVPPAELLAGYNREIPDGANRLFTLIEKQSDHRQVIEKRIIDTQSKVTKRGQWIALCLVVGLTAVASYFGYQGQVALSGTIFATTIVSVATAFIVGRGAQQRSLVRKSGK